MFRVILTTGFLSAVIGLPQRLVHADSYTSLTQGVPGFAQAAEKASAGDFAGFINNLYNMSIGIASVIAVFVIIYAGVRISTLDNVGIISELRSRVGMALGGLVLLLGAYVLLNYINPELTVFSGKADNLVKINYEGVSNFEPTSVVLADVVVPQQSGAPVYYYVPITADGPAENETYPSEIECLRHSGVTRCQRKEVSQESPSGAGGSIASVALSELQTYGGIKEGRAEMCNRIKEYARVTTGNSAWNCTASSGTGPWSAIFISFVMYQAGVGHFPRSTSHSTYIQEAARGSQGMRAFPFGSQVANPGDLICRTRRGSQVTFDSILSYTQGFPSHCDVVVSNDGAVIVAVGGNLSDTVGRVTYRAQGGVPVPTPTSIAILKVR